MEVVGGKHKSIPPDNLPNGMIGLQTTLGEQLLKRASVVNHLMVERFANQVNRTYCGPASLSLLVNAMDVAYRIKYMQIQGNETAEKEYYDQIESQQRYHVTEDDIVNLVDIKEYLSSTDINNNGTTLQQLKDMAGILGFGVNSYFACGFAVCENETIHKKLKDIVTDNNDYMFKDVAEFKTFAKDYITRPVAGLIVNYDMNMLGYKGLCGHFSPLAAYDEETDRFLVMDVWPDTPPAWVLSENLFKAMSTIDSASGLPRGLLHIYELLF